MKEKGISAYEGGGINMSLDGWLRRLVGVLPRTRSYESAINPASIAANAESVQSFTVKGLSASDVLTVNKPSSTAGLDLVQAWATKDTLNLKFRNHTGSAIDPGSETYRIIATRL